VTLAVKGNTISGRSFPFQRVPEFYRHRLLLTGSRCYIQWLIDRRTKPIFCVFPVFSVAVMEKCCDACREGNTICGRSFSVSEGAGVSLASITVDRKSMGHKMADRSSNEADFLCISCIERGGYGKGVVTLAVKGNTISGWLFSASEGAGVSEASTAVDRKSMGHKMADRSSNEADFLCISCI
jgi:hypothetical protein